MRTKRRWRCLTSGAGKTHRACPWGYCTTGFEREQLVVFDFAENCAGKHPAQFLRAADGTPWRRTLVCDDYSGYKALFAPGVTEGGCPPHARRKFHKLWVNYNSAVGEHALALFGKLYEVEREVADLDATERLRIRPAKARPAADA